MSSLENLLTKVCSLVAKPPTEFPRLDAMDFIESIKNVAHDSQHAKANYYKFVYEARRPCVADLCDEQFRAY